MSEDEGGLHVFKGNLEQLKFGIGVVYPVDGDMRTRRRKVEEREVCAM